MQKPAAMYEMLIDLIPSELKVTGLEVGKKWVKVSNSAGGLGQAWSLDIHNRPSGIAAFEGLALKDVASLILRWNLAECSIAQAAINSWYSHPDVAASHGFVPTGEGTTWGQLFDPYIEKVEGKKVAVIGHFPFAQAALARAGEYICLERNMQAGDYPDSACEYLLPECDYVFISGSSFVNKTAPRLLALAAQAHTVVVGPSTPLHPGLLECGVNTLMGHVTTVELNRPLLQIGRDSQGLVGGGYRVHKHAQ